LKRYFKVFPFNRDRIAENQNEQKFDAAVFTGIYVPQGVS
jgi:hypothetical protein